MHQFHHCLLQMQHHKASCFVIMSEVISAFSSTHAPIAICIHTCTHCQDGVLCAIHHPIPACRKCTRHQPTHCHVTTSPPRSPLPSRFASVIAFAHRSNRAQTLTTMPPTQCVLNSRTLMTYPSHGATMHASRSRIPCKPHHTVLSSLLAKLRCLRRDTKLCCQMWCA